jgi:hypothetical protein
MELPKRENHAINTYELRKNLFRLISLFMGLSAILEDKEGFMEDLKSSVLFKEYPHLFEEEFSKLILEIAINARVLDDIIKSDAKYKNLNAFEDAQPMGIIDEELFYSPREAINKIIHADYVGHDIRTDNVKPYYMPAMLLTGCKGRKEWICEIYLLPLCRVLYDFAHENDLSFQR